MIPPYSQTTSIQLYLSISSPIVLYSIPLLSISSQSNSPGSHKHYKFCCQGFCRLSFLNPEIPNLASTAWWKVHKYLKVYLPYKWVISHSLPISAIMSVISWNHWCVSLQLGVMIEGKDPLVALCLGPMRPSQSPLTSSGRWRNRMWDADQWWTIDVYSS